MFCCLSLCVLGFGSSGEFGCCVGVWFVRVFTTFWVWLCRLLYVLCVAVCCGLLACAFCWVDCLYDYAGCLGYWLVGFVLVTDLG